jgi:glycosyltransferase involved in cell wall biosynthesis
VRILMVAARYLPFMGGIETHIHEAGRRLADQGHQVTVLTTDPRGVLPARERVCGMDIVRVKAWPAERDYYLAPAIFRQVMRMPADVVHVQGYHTLVPPLAMLASLRRRIPFVLTFHSGGHSSDLRNSLRGVQRRLLRPLVKNAAQLIGVSQFEADFFSETLRLPRSRFVVVPNGAEMPNVPPRTVARGGGRTILSVGRLERYKGHHRVIQAFPHFLQRHPDARLRVMGAGPYEPELKAFAERSGVSDRISIGAIAPSERDQMAGVMADASLVTLLSDYEAHPVAVLEALSLDRPVLVSDTSGFRELARDGLVRAIPLDTSPEAVAQAMTEQMTDPVRRPGIALPRWDACADQLLQIYERVAGFRPERLRA